MNVYICDIDGTIAENSHREHLAKAKQWDAFFDLCDRDEPVQHMRTLLNDLVESGAIIAYVTGRPERVRDKTLNWLRGNSFPTGWKHCMFMRKDGDHRSDHIIKVELLAIVRAEIGDPIMVFDDRNSVVKMWREIGIPCAQVAEGDF